MLVPIDFSETSIWAIKIKQAVNIVKLNKVELILFTVFKKSGNSSGKYGAGCNLWHVSQIKKKYFVWIDSFTKNIF